MNITIYFKKKSDPIVYTDISNAYELGSFYNVVDHNRKTEKWPITSISKIVEQRYTTPSPRKSAIVHRHW